MTPEEMIQAAREGGLDLSTLPILPAVQASLSRELDWETRSDNSWWAAQLIHLKVASLLPPLPCPFPDALADDALVARAWFDPVHLEEATQFLRRRLAGSLVIDSDSPGDDSAGSEDGSSDPRLLNLHDVVRLARRALAVAKAHEQIDMLPPDSRIEDMIELLESALAEAGNRPIGLDELLSAQMDGGRRVSLFLAVLELARIARIRIEQEDTFDPIHIAPR